MTERILVVIAGATGAIGQAVEKAALASGRADVLAISRTIESTTTAFRRAKRVDLADTVEVDKLFAESDQYSAISWVHCVGLFNEYKTARNTSADEIRQVISSNIFPLINAVKAWLPAASNAGHGNFIQFSANSVSSSLPFMAGFNAAKAASEAFLQSVSNETISEGIALNTLRLSTVDTPLERAMKPHGDVEHWTQPIEVGEYAIEMALDMRRFRPRGAIISMYVPSTTYFGDSVLKRFNKTY